MGSAQRTFGMYHLIRSRSAALGAATATALLLVAAASAQAQSVEQYYAGKQAKLIIGGGAGGGYDFYGRLIAPFLSRHLPGHPTFVPVGMPGAGGIVAANYLYNVALKDG